MILIFNMGFLLQMPMSQVPQMYGQSVMPTQLPTPPMFVPSQLPVVRFISPILWVSHEVCFPILYCNVSAPHPGYLFKQNADQNSVSWWRILHLWFNLLV